VNSIATCREPESWAEDEMQMPPGYGDALKPGCDIDAIAKISCASTITSPMLMPHTKNKASVFRITDCKFTNAVLEMRSSSNRLDRARKLSQETRRQCC